jgi:hypothetical protein
MGISFLLAGIDSMGCPVNLVWFVVEHARWSTSTRVQVGTKRASSIPQITPRIA